jgi:hypothetical protein
MASHFPANRFYKRHLDKKLQLVGFLGGQLSALGALRAAEANQAIDRLVEFLL